MDVIANWVRREMVNKYVKRKFLVLPETVGTISL